MKMFKSRAARGNTTTEYGAPTTHGTHETHGNTTTDYGTPVARSNKMHRPLLLATHILHWISSIIVMSIAAYFIHKFRHNTHLLYWVSIAAIDAILYLPALALPVVKSYKGYLAPLAWIFSYLWLTAFVFATQDYSGGRCVYNSPTFVTECGLKKTLAAFAFIAFFTNLVGTLLEGRLWDVQRFKGGTHHSRNHTFESDKQHPRPVGEHTGTHTGTTAPHTGTATV